MNTLPEPDTSIKHFEFTIQAWEKALGVLAGDFKVYAPIRDQDSIDYELISSVNISSIVYNTPKPVSPLKLFLLPVKENVVRESDLHKPFVVLGTPACDLWALDLLDTFYLDPDYPDIYYKARRDNMIVIGADCHSSLEHCHCTSYGIMPVPNKNQDLVLSRHRDKILIGVSSAKGELIMENIASQCKADLSENSLPESLRQLRSKVKTEIDRKNKRLPNYQETSSIVKNTSVESWKNHSARCVSCGACATICPTCTCFLLIDKPGFEKVKQMDACQYPGFQRVAGGEDPHKKLHARFCNRYYCKYVWRPEKFDEIACTGCGRCIEGCIGNISKNEIFIELSQ